jgi:hypothetical protein
MRYKIILAVFGMYPLVAQTPRACIGQLVPLKPVSVLSCRNATALCLTDANGFQGRWVWTCPQNGALDVPNQDQIGRPGGFLDPGIISNGVQPVKIDSPLEIMQRVEQLRQLRLQNQQIEQQNREMERRLNQPAPPPVAAPPTPQESAAVHLTFKMLMPDPFFDSVGLNKLTPEEMARLDAWLTSYSVALSKIVNTPKAKEGTDTGWQ